MYYVLNYKRNNLVLILGRLIKLNIRYGFCRFCFRKIVDCDWFVELI